jgi:HD-like signal output (HDOD) protein
MVLQRLSEIQELPTLPEVLLRIRSLITSDEGDASILARIIEQDPSLSSKILKIANSSFYCSSNQHINSIQYAVTRIGFNEIGHIAMAVSLIRKFTNKSDILDYKQFWRHSLTAAFLTDMVADISGVQFSPRERQALFLSGLFHDIGILIYDQFFHDQFETIVDLAMKKEISFLEAEHEISPNESHALVGSALLELWKLDVPVVSGVRYHHNPEKSPESFVPVALATHFSEYILCNSGIGSFEGTIEHGNKPMISALHINQDMMNSFFRLAEYEVDKSDLVLALETDNSNIQLRAV